MVLTEFRIKCLALEISRTEAGGVWRDEGLGWDVFGCHSLSILNIFGYTFMHLGG
jgi:hypothetical protein